MPGAIRSRRFSKGVVFELALSPAGEYFVVMAVISFLSTFIGRILPESWFDWRRFPYKSRPFEKDGKIYQHLSIQKWYKKLPDASRVFRHIFPDKSLKSLSKEKLCILLKETCVAEFVHCSLCVIGFCYGKLNEGPGVRLLTWMYILIGNLPFILIQRYNRPRLLRLLNRMQIREMSVNFEAIVT